MKHKNISEVLGDLSATNSQRLTENPGGKYPYTPILMFFLHIAQNKRILERILDKDLLSSRKAVVM